MTWREWRRIWYAGDGRELRLPWRGMIFIALLLCISAVAHCETLPIYPDKVLTPGVVKTTDKATVCRIGYTRDARLVTEAMKREVAQRYHLTVPRSQWGKIVEFDHEISLELGGANDIENLWPEPYAGQWGARKKDVIETRLHRLVCAGKLTLPEAQQCIRDDWIKCFQKYAPAKKRK